MITRNTRYDRIMLGDRGVLAAVLLRAINDVRENNGHAQQAAAWINSDREDHPCAFLKICEALALSPDAVRRTVQTRGNESPGLR